ncbi:transcription factor TFIIB repeat-containing protein [Halopiger aswanensis]|uniref:Transcription factor TFIIB repeat-containing protein n=1 Tax=Halopiger aswanensis TaxID=148449 RepID=A0A419W089_9EURY|nr:transcription factor TFIIB repeat-containing protein [Halopiger aswanensis]
MFVPSSLARLGLGELIAPVENLFARLVESDCIVPPFRRVEEVRLIGVTAEVDGDVAVVVSLCGHVVNRVRVVLVLLRSQWRSKRERNLATGLGEVRCLVSALGLSDSFREQACSHFRRAQREDLCRGRSLEGVAAASVYAVSRCNGVGRTLEEISQVATCSRSQLECAYSAMNTELELPTAVPQPKRVLPRLATKLETPDSRQTDPGLMYWTFASDSLPFLRTGYCPVSICLLCSLVVFGSAGRVHTNSTPDAVVQFAVYAATTIGDVLRQSCREPRRYARLQPSTGRRGSLSSPRLGYPSDGVRV